MGKNYVLIHTSISIDSDTSLTCSVYVSGQFRFHVLISVHVVCDDPN